jgi:hypothetical protein
MKQSSLVVIDVAVVTLGRPYSCAEAGSKWLRVNER